MYYPIGWHKVLNVDTQRHPDQCNILAVQANHERELFFILTTRSIHIWNPKPPVEIICHRRSNESIESIGLNRSAVWKLDSSVIVVATDRDQLLFYQLRRRNTTTSATTFLSSNSTSNDSIFRLRDGSKNVVKNLLKWNRNEKNAVTSSLSDSIPALTIFSFGKLDLSAVGVSCLMPAEEEIIVGARNGNIYGVLWNGSVDNKFPWSLTKEVKKSTEYIVDIKFSSVLSGFALVFKSGKVGFMPLNQKKSHDGSLKHKESQINFLSGIDDALCVEVNHKYRLISFGLKSSKVVVCNVDDSNASLIINHTLELDHCKYPHDTRRLGGINCMKYSPDNVALVTSWSGGDFAIWSVFGSLLFCSQQWHSESQENKQIKPLTILSLDWGREGYSLWLSIDRSEFDDGESLLDSSSSTTNGHATTIEGRDTEEVLILSIAHSAISASPHLTCSSDAIILIGEERLYVGPSVPHEDKFDHWFIIDIPQTYLDVNYPIRYATIDRESKNLAIAGNSGFAKYSLKNSSWKFFSKKSEENNFSVCGDMIWWKDYLVFSCFNFETGSFELRAYLTNNNLANDNLVVQATPMEVIRLSIFENRLLVLYIDGTLSMFMLNLRRKPPPKKSMSRMMRSDSFSSANVTSNNTTDLQPSPKSTRSESIMNFNYPLKHDSSYRDVTLQIAPIENLVISNLQANAYCISSIALTRLHFKNNRTDDSILLNACGKLFLLEREIPPDLAVPTLSTSSSSVDLNGLSLCNHKSNELDAKVNSAIPLPNSIHLASASLKNTSQPSALSNVTFKAVSVIATNVEQFWISPEIFNASDMSYFKKSLWLFCGGPNNYFQVWLPLLNDKNDPPTDLYVPDRIMLPIKCDIYPLAIRSSAPEVVEPDDAIVLGAESDILYRDSKLFTSFPYSTVKRQCRVYLHRILRELLLNQHLGYYARKIAESCQSLPYFAHCCELLLHEVLEEEATSPVPLPDPMLPQVVRFIKEFPVYLETVVHCARKSELSMWSYLFDERAVGNPRRLFQECLEKHKLATAASCLIILQSLDRNIVSQRMVKELIKAAKDDPDYSYLIQDLESFLSRAEIDYNNVSGSGSPNS